VDSRQILSTRGLNTLMFSDPYAKLCCTSIFASQCDKVIYVDLDTTFTAYFMAGLVNTNHVDIYLPSEGRFVPMIKDVLAKMPSSSLVIFDSVNSFYNMFKAQNRTGSLNHLLSIFLMLLVRQGMDSRVPVLATSMLRYRKDGGWVQSPASRRLLQHKSVVKLSVERQGGDLALKVVEHESMPPGTKVIYRNSAITV
jgi:hypothetical protein